MIMNRKIKEDIVKELNENYGRDLSDLSRCKEIRNFYQDIVNNLQSELHISNPNSSFIKAINNAEAIIENIKTVKELANDVRHDLEKHLNETNHFTSTLEDKFTKLKRLETTSQYFKIINYTDILSLELEKQLEKKDDEQCVSIFANLAEIARQLSLSSAIHLTGHLKGTVRHWHDILKDKYSQEFNEILRLIKWPFVNVNFSFQTPSSVHTTKLQGVVEYLLQIDLPDELLERTDVPSYLQDFPPLSLPLEQLIYPLRKRFTFHFYGSRKTNQCDKPEWYFTKILSWIRDHTEFLEKWVQPVIDRMGLYYIDAKVEFMRGLVQLTVEKLYSDLPSLQFDDFTFSHCVDEALGFDKELKENYDYPLSQPGVLTVLTQASFFLKWLSMERKYATEKMDAILSDSNEVFYPIDNDPDGLKIAPCAEIFVTLLQTITERYEVLPQPGHRLQFLDLQLGLLDDFRVRLLQLMRVDNADVLSSRLPIIANITFYIENVLEDWGAMVHFLTLYYYKSQLENPKSDTVPSGLDLSKMFDVETDTVFAETLQLYRHMRKDLMTTLIDHVIKNITKRAKSYTREDWSSMVTFKDMRSFSLTSSSCLMFEVIANSLHLLEKHLTEKLFVIAWRAIAQQLDKFLLDDLVLENRFNEGGALQFKYDIVRNLYPLFSQHTNKPDSYFSQLHEAIILLNISKGSALLLRTTLIELEGATGVEDMRGLALKEMGVHTFAPKMALRILNCRADITVNREID